ncbi:MAG TPA: N-acetylmuramoyl-L-alanine amidase [Vicinamibacterales bacterium]|nr:N-acetylmuramoyl-L-alanine amidase [Vicinamibacterales bacterium]
MLLAPAAAGAQTAALAFERAQQLEQDAPTASPQTVEALRKIARTYEAIAYKHPVSGYSDNALWQAAGLFEKVYEQSKLDRDRDAATKDLTWLQREYPHSPFAKQVAAKIAALTAAPATTTAPAASAPSAPPPPAIPPRPPVSPGTSLTIKDVSLSTLPRGDRLTIELSGEAPFTGERVSNPDRVFFDFPNASTAASVAAKVRQMHSPLIKAIRVGEPSKGVTRVVLELASEPRYSTFPLYDPFRLIVDVESTAALSTGPSTDTSPAPRTPSPNPSASTVPAVAEVTPSSALPPPAPPATTQKGGYSLSRQLGLRVSRVVIDAGHGGHDPGAQSNGVTEAELVLDVALRLEKLLSQMPGVEVILTRRTNEFIPLEERTAIANRENADLFLSIHANAHRQAAIRGIESYVLNFAMNDEAEAVAARENATSGQTMGTLPAIVKAISLNNKLTESRELASQLQTALIRRLRSQSTGVKDLGVKQAPFVVLIGAQMPSVLTEIAFLTNRPESALLKQAAYRQQIAQALKDGVVRYQESLKKVTTVAVRERDPRQ